MAEVNDRIFQLETPNLAAALMGTHDNFLKLIEESLTVELLAFDDHITLRGQQPAIDQAEAVLINLVALLQHGITLSATDVVSAAKMAQKGTISEFQGLYTDPLIKDRKGRYIRVKNFGQRQYINAIRHNDVTFGIGPAGTGKTFLAVVMAVAALKQGQVEQIILTRPAVEAGESLGFLPGDLKEKVDPYLRPIYDALYAVLGKEHTERLLERGVIEIAPLAYMRGRTLETAFVILDEAQNTTPAQMKMFLTRLGFGSKMVVNGDVSQIDLPRKSMSGLVQAEQILQDIAKIEFVKFGAEDVVRHPVVAKIINAYAEIENTRK